MKFSILNIPQCGNTKSVELFFSNFGVVDVINIDQLPEISSKSILILPGVGSYSILGNLSASIIHVKNMISNHYNANGKILGICLGFQMLGESSEESPGSQGLGFLKNLHFIDLRARGYKSNVGLRNVYTSHIGLEDSVGYFMHRYACIDYCGNDEEILFYSETAGINILAGIVKGNIAGFQFHPERSGIHGIEFIENLLRSWK